MNEDDARFNKLAAQVTMLRYIVLLLCRHTCSRREITKLVEGLTGPLPFYLNEDIKGLLEDEISEFSEIPLTSTEQER